MELFFSFTMFLLLLSALLSAGAGRAESRYSGGGSTAVYAAAVALAAGLLTLRLAQRSVWAPDNFFDGALFAITALGAAVLVSAARGWRIDPVFPAALSLVLGGIGFLRSDAAAAQAREGPGGHTLLMFLALAAFSASFVASVAFVAQDGAIKAKKLDGIFMRLPPLEMTGRLNLLFLAVGTASMFAGVLAGALAREGVSAGALVTQPTSLLSIAMLVVYSSIVTLRIGPLERGRGTAYASIVTYAFLVLTFAAAHASSGGPR